MTTTLDRPETTHRVDQVPKVEPPRRRGRGIGIALVVLALIAAGVVIAVNGVGATESLTQGQITYGQRLEQMAENYAPPQLSQGRFAEASRLTEQAQHYGAVLTPAQQAEADRWAARARAELGLTQGQQANAERYEALADELTRARRAETERWQSLADSFE